MHVRHALPGGGCVEFMGEAGNIFSTDPQFVRANAAGAPLDRFLGTKSYVTEARHGQLDLVILGTIPRGAADLRLWFGDETVPRQQALTATSRTTQENVVQAGFLRDAVELSELAVGRVGSQARRGRA